MQSPFTAETSPTTLQNAIALLNEATTSAMSSIVSLFWCSGSGCGSLKGVMSHGPRAYPESPRIKAKMNPLDKLNLI